MGKKDKFRPMSATYLRFKKQLKALETGRLRTVKKLALEARRELILKSRVSQLSLSLTG